MFSVVSYSPESKLSRAISSDTPKAYQSLSICIWSQSCSLLFTNVRMSEILRLK